MKIAVTAYDINQGQRAKCCLCPVALALKRQLHGKALCIFVGTNGIEFLTRADNGWRSFAQYDVQRRIQDYDADGTMEPFSFEIPDELFEPRAA